LRKNHSQGALRTPPPARDRAHCIAGAQVGASYASISVSAGRKDGDGRHDAGHGGTARGAM
jgi:hypothetical protein